MFASKAGAYLSETFYVPSLTDKQNTSEKQVNYLIGPNQYGPGAVFTTLYFLRNLQMGPACQSVT